jgi:aminopeptidase N
MRSAFVFFAYMVVASTVSVAAPGIDLRRLHDPAFETPIHAPRPAASDVESTPRNRPARFDVEHYDLDVTVDPVAGTIRGQVGVTFRSLVSRLATIELDAKDMQIIAVRTNGLTALPFSYDGTLLTVQLDSELAGHETARVDVEYVALTPQNMLLAGPDVTSPQRIDQAYTFTQPEGSQTWYPCLDRPSDKATATITVRVPDGFKALSNGDLEATQSTAAGSMFRYRMEFPIATYLISLAIGDYEVHSLGEFNGKPLTLWAAPDVVPAALAETRGTLRMMEVFGAFAGVDYAFNSYAQSVAQAYRTSMEHQAATTMGGWRISGDGTGESVVAHELAHQWFGDLVTCRHWGELWLNEGFASYLPQVYFDAIGDRSRSLGQLDYWRFGYFDEARTWAHALSSPTPAMDNLFDSHAYEKGALVINLMRAVANRLPIGEGGKRGVVTEETFTRALRRYLNARRFDTVTSEDLQRALEAETGQSWQVFFDQWVRSPGHVIASVTTAHADGVLRITVEQTQTRREEGAWGLFNFPLEVEIVHADGSVTYESFDVYDDVQTFAVAMADAPQAINADPDWLVPAEIDVEQSDAAWLAVVRHSPLDKSRIAALRQLSPAALADSAAITLVKADASRYLKTDALSLLSGQEANRPLVADLFATIGAEPNLDVTTRDALALTEAWLVRTLGALPTRDDERRWQDRWLETESTTERQSLIEMLKVGSIERAQAFAASRLAEPQWVTRDRWRIVELLGAESTPTSEAFYVQALDLETAPVYFNALAAVLAAREHDQAGIVPGLIRVATGARQHSMRGNAIRLLGDQRSSQGDVCPVLSGLGGGSPTPDLSALARAAYQDLGCEL